MDWGRVAAGIATGGTSELVRGGAKLLGDSGLGDLLFGEKPSINSYENMTPEQKKLLETLLGQVQGTAETGVTPYSGDIYAGPSSLNQSLFSGAENLLAGNDPTQAVLDKMLNRYSEGAMYEFNPNRTIDMFNASVRDPAMREFNTEILPGIAEKYAGQNAGRSGAVLKTMADAGADLERNLSGQLSQYLYNAEDQSNKNKLSFETGVLPGIIDQPLQNLQSLMGIAGTQQGIDQSQLTEDFQKWEYGQDYNNPWLQYLNSLLGLQTTTPVVNPGTPGLLQSLLPALGQMGSAAMMML
jgi:hypothetical protein